MRKRGVGGAPAAQPRHPIYVLYHGSSFGYFIVGIVLLIVIGIPTLVCLYRLYETAVRL